jgi:hypothetical protein
MINKKEKTFTCPQCKQKQEILGVIQNEIRHYKVYLDAKQWEDFGEESVESQTFFCISCDKKIDDDIGNDLL